MYSMTGCGKGTADNEAVAITIEIKSVNHRYLDLALRLPRPYSFLEETLRRQIAGCLRRGHIEVQMAVSPKKDPEVSVQINQTMAEAYLRAGEQLRALGASGSLDIRDLLSLEGVAKSDEAAINEDEYRQLAEQACTDALDELVRMRISEGENLKRDLSDHLRQVTQLRKDILTLAPTVSEQYRQRLAEKCRAVLPEGASVDPVRLEQEVLLFADRCAIDEELSRLESHIMQFNRFLGTDGEIGKKMDFLIQEMNREANTIGSKANDADIAHLVVELKSEIEKLREQVQNVE